MRAQRASRYAYLHRQEHLGMRKVSEDVARYEIAIKRTQPELIIECGTFTGRSALWFSQWCEVVSIDVDHGNLTGDVIAAAGDRVTWLLGSSTDKAIVNMASRLAGKRSVLVSLDSDHSAAHVLAEMEAYAPLVNEGGYLVVEDGIIANYDGPALAIRRFLDSHPEWQPDIELEDAFPVTLFPCGWLRKGWH